MLNVGLHMIPLPAYSSLEYVHWKPWVVWLTPCNFWSTPTLWSSLAIQFALFAHRWKLRPKFNAWIRAETEEVGLLGTYSAVPFEGVGAVSGAYRCHPPSVDDVQSGSADCSWCYRRRAHTATGQSNLYCRLSARPLAGSRFTTAFRSILAAVQPAGAARVIRPTAGWGGTPV